MLKKTSSGRYLNFMSAAPLNYKKNVATNIISRVINFTNAQDRPELLEKAKKSLIENQYPLTFINNIIKKSNVPIL